MIVVCSRCSDIEVVILPERHLCSKLLMNMLSIRVVVVLEVLVGRVICGIKLFERSISRKSF